MSRNVQIATVEDNDARTYEKYNVHQIYDEIAEHFSSTRYKPWPVIAKFLSDIPTGWIGLDSGTGNGKYLPLPLDGHGRILTIGLDRSRKLLKIARTVGEPATVREVIRGDILENPWRDGVFDYCISIATIHHLATAERRKEAVKLLLQCVSPKHGRVLIYVWAVEQDELSKRHIPTDNDAASMCSPHGIGKDVLVPWVLSSPDIGQTKEPKVLNRYYHMFSKGELISLVSLAAEELGLEVGVPSNIGHGQGVNIAQDGWERSNHYVEIRRWQAS